MWWHRRWEICLIKTVKSSILFTAVGLHRHVNRNWVSVHYSKNDVISSVRKQYCAIGLVSLGLVEIGFRSNVFSSKCSRTMCNCIYLCFLKNVFALFKFMLSYSKRDSVSFKMFWYFLTLCSCCRMYERSYTAQLIVLKDVAV